MTDDRFTQGILHWFDSGGRKDLPWQQNATPYRVWVSEIMLQQTQVATVMPYYLRFMEAFPDVTALADAELDEVLRLWSGLGYYARARNLYKAACEIRDRYDGKFPERFDDTVALPGVGRSTAGAILSLSLGRRHAILDGNVKRVVARYHAVSGWPGRSSVSRELWDYADQHTPDENVAAYTQAIMDFGATVCTMRSPACTTCPLGADCQANVFGSQADYPGKQEKKAKPHRHTHMALALCDGHLFLEQRPPSGIWGGLWSLPEFTSEKRLVGWCEQRLTSAAVRIERWTMLRHSFSHYDLEIRPVVVRLDKGSRNLADADGNTDAGIWYRYSDAPRFGLAAPVKKLIEKVKSNVTNS